MFRGCFDKRRIFTLSKGNTTAEELTHAISVESILIIGESNWIQLETVIWFVLFVWLNQTNQTDYLTPGSTLRCHHLDHSR